MMKAIALQAGTSNIQIITDYPEPAIASPDEVKIQVLEVGICGTDREEAAGGRAQAPAGKNQLVIGHEMVGRVVAVGSAVTRVAAGDTALFTVRRGCGECLPCRMNRPDMCQTGRFTERGIWGADGYQTQFVVDKEQYVVRIPPEIQEAGVLAEPASIVEKAIDEAVRIQMARLPGALATPKWLDGRRCLVAGLGPVGLLGALILRLSGAEVYGLDVVDPGSPRPQWLAHIGGSYVDGRSIPPDQLDTRLPPFDLVVEATGIASLEFNLLDALNYDGIYVPTGIPGGDRPLQLDGAELIRSLVLKNLLMVGSVNASRDHYEMAVDHLAEANQRWPGWVGRLITARVPLAGSADALHQHASDEIKTVIDWNGV
jgi:threonine dehydrogenase-like Zn-dependent dehydrogenase